MKPDATVDRNTRVRIWEAGTGLGLSWMTFGDDRQKQKQLLAKGTPQSPFYIELMLGDIWGRLSEGSLVAMGFCTYPKTSDGPIRIPADSFSVWQKPSLDNLMSDDVAVFGWKYENVKIIKSEEYSALLAETLESKPKSDSGTTVDVESLQPSIQRSKNAPGIPVDAKRNGRPRKIEILVEIIEALVSENSLQRVGNKERFSRIGSKSRELYPLIFRNDKEPSISSMKRAMKLTSLYG